MYIGREGPFYAPIDCTMLELCSILITIQGPSFVCVHPRFGLVFPFHYGAVGPGEKYCRGLWYASSESSVGCIGEVLFISDLTIGKELL